MANYFDTGILLTAGFSLSGQAPLDGRSVVELLTDLDTHIAENRAYEGMCVYVKENKKIYIYNGTTWEEFVGGGSSEKQIKDWVSGSSYLEGDYIYHEGELYRCLTTNNNIDFDETNWEQVTYGIDELSKEDVERLLGLTEEEIEAMADLILDTEVRIDKTYSSSKIYTDIQQCLEDGKTFTLLELGKISKASYKVVASTSEMTSESIIYLLANGNTYDMYIVEENGATTKIGDTNVNLSDYYTKTEIDNDFLKKVDADGKYATITTVDGKVDKDKIVTALDGSATDDEVASAKAVYDGLENINDFSVQVVKENLDLNDITETGIYFFPQTYTPVNIPVGVNGWLLVMKGNSSDIVKQVWYRQGTADVNSYNTFERCKVGNTWSKWTKFLTEKEYYNALDYGNPIIPQDADLNDYLTVGVYSCTDSTIAKTLVNCPHIDSNFKLIVNKNRGNSDIFYGYQMIVGTKGGNPVKDVCIYYRGVTTSSDGVSAFSKWKIMSGSTVADVLNVDVTSLMDTTSATAENILYTVKNGWCIVKVNSIKPLISGSDIIIILPEGTLPKTDGHVYANLNNWDTSSTQNILVRVGTSGAMGIWCASGNENIAYFGSFSYPVAE